MTGGEQDLVAWKPTQAPRQHSVQYMLRKALLRRAPFSTFAQISRPPVFSSAFLWTALCVIMILHAGLSHTYIGIDAGLLLCCLRRQSVETC